MKKRKPKTAKKLYYKTEPTLKIHKYVATVTNAKKTKFHYCINRKEVRDLRAKLAKKSGTIVHVFKAVHNFTEGWEVN